MAIHKNFRYKKSTISYSIYGNGQPVVLLHGFAEDSSIWNNQVSYLGKHCQLIIPDLPGSGKSELLQGSHVSMDDYADCIYALLKKEEIENCILLGHSMGGYITLAFANKYVSKLKGFGLVHSTAFQDSDEKKAVRQKGIKLIEEYGALALIKNITPNLFSATFREKHPEQISSLIEQGENFTTSALVQYYTAIMNRPDLTEVLRASPVPVLFIIGSEDAVAPLADLLQQVHLPAITHIHIIQDVGHMSMVEAPDDLNKYLLNFIQA
jgi:pimeloyl-ACP methyl ester carboxylesterase